MAKDASYSLSDSEYVDIMTYFKEAVDEAVEQVQHVFSDLKDINEAAKYQVVIEHTKNFADNYTNELQQEVLAIYDEWQSEGENVHQFMLTVEAGASEDDESVAAAHKLEDEMRDAVLEAFAVAPDLYEGSTLVQLSEYGGKEKLFSDIDELLQRFDNAMTELIVDVERSAEDKGEHNEIYMSVGGVLSSLLTAYQKFFEGFSEGMAGNLSEHVSAANDAAVSNIEADKEQLKGKAENVGDMLKSISSLFQL